MIRAYINILFLLFLFSCETLVEVPVPDLKPLITVNALFNPDSLMKVSVLTTARFLDSIQSFDPISDATVIATSSSGERFDFRLVRDEYISDHYPEIGETYELTVSAPGYPDPVKAVCAIPARIPEFQVVDYGFAFGPLNDIDKFFYIDIQINDPANEENYYAVDLYEKEIDYNVTYEDTTWIYTPVDTITTGRRVWVDHLSNEGKKNPDNARNFPSESCINGKYFDSEQPVIRVWAIESENNIPVPDGLTFTIILKEISHGYYQYSLDFNRQRDIDRDFWAEPVSIYSNIEGGAGIFAAETSGQITKDHPDKALLED